MPSARARYATSTTWVGLGAAAVGLAFVSQFALLDLLFRGVGAWAAQPRTIGDVLSTASIWTLALTGTSFIRRRPARVFATTGVPVMAAILLVTQVFVFRYYHTPLDVQVAASALHSWHDVRGVLVRAAPGFVGAVAFVAALQVSGVRFALAAHGDWLRARLMPLLMLASAAGLVTTGVRSATPDVRALHALRALAIRPPVKMAASISLPTLMTERRSPHVLFVLTESVRAPDYTATEDERGPATAPETARVTVGRGDLRQMRAVSSYTAVSVSALLTGRSQEGHREEILRSPSLFDYAHAVRDRRGARPTVGYYSSQSETVFETTGVRGAVDRFVTVETLRGRDVEDDADYAELPLDRETVDRFVADLPSFDGPGFLVLHLVGTHAPYFVEPSRAPFQPFAHVVTWAGMQELHAAYKNAIHEQDRDVARAISAFIAHAKDEPWLVVFTSDHGEAFGENGAIHHGQNLFDEQVHVPGFVAAGNGALSEVQERALRDHSERFVTHLDVLPTILDAMGILENFGIASHRAQLPGRSLLRPYEARPPLPVTNCTGMFTCPLNTWGLYEGDHKLVARVWDAGWQCFVLGPPTSRTPVHGEAPAGEGDPACLRLREASRRWFAQLPNGAPNR